MSRYQETLWFAIFLLTLIGMAALIRSRQAHIPTQTVVLSNQKIKTTPTPTDTYTPTLTFTNTATPAATATLAPTPAVLIGAGDIALCDNSGDSKTATIIERLLKQHPDATVFTAGDNVQMSGTEAEFTDCFDPTWGRFKDHIRPSPGNHDWYTLDGAPYFAYFGEAAGQPGLGYYSYDLGSWHIVTLNSNCDYVDCSEKSAQVEWLRSDLKETPSRCTLLYWHHPVWDSGKVKIIPGVMNFWRIANQYGAEVVVNGHDHHYERVAPLDSRGQINWSTGTREFIVATGGAWLFDTNAPKFFTESMDSVTKGVIQFLLYPDHYTWQFYPVNGGNFTDSGSAKCH